MPIILRVGGPHPYGRGSDLDSGRSVWTSEGCDTHRSRDREGAVGSRCRLSCASEDPTLTGGARIWTPGEVCGRQKVATLIGTVTVRERLAPDADYLARRRTPPLRAGLGSALRAKCVDVRRLRHSS